MDFKCAWFDGDHFYEFYPLQVVHKTPRAKGRARSREAISSARMNVPMRHVR
jgi:hypothetical protein